MSRKISLILIGISSICVTLGDMRNVITPLGYWIIWGIWFVFAGLMYVINKTNTYPKMIGWGVLEKLVIIGFIFLILSFFVSGALYSDKIAVYQGLKLMVIFFIGMLIWHHSWNITHEYLVRICKLSIITSLSIYLLSKYIFVEHYIVLGDGRHGSTIVYPGVLWKAGAFFSIFILADILQVKKIEINSITVYICGIVLVLIDGSRTGLLMLLLTNGLLVFLWLLKMNRRILLFRSGLIIMFAFVLWIINLIITPQQFKNIVIVGFERLSYVDTTRLNMLNDGINYAERCFLFGCGLGTAVTETDIGPMVVHNAYIATLSDFGLLGVIGIMLIAIGPILASLLGPLTRMRLTINQNSYIIFASFLCVLGFSLTLALHPLSTEMSEWGFYFLITRWLFSRPSMATRD